jgi:exopolysaccharide production protein ExoZ
MGQDIQSNPQTVPPAPDAAAARPGNSFAKSPLLSIQYLRAIAALMVAYFHACVQIPLFTPYFRNDMLGRDSLASGVDIFFVISGFIMMVTSKTTPPGEFAARRIIRVVPLYWILTSLLAALALAFPSLFRTTVVNLEFYVKSMLFIPYLNPGHAQDLVPLLVPGWSLNFEMFFYAIFALVLFAPQRRRLGINGIVFVGLVLTAFLLSNSGVRSEWLFYGDIRIFEFWMGMLIAHFFLHSELKFPLWVPWVILAGGFAAIIFPFAPPGFMANAAGRTLIANMLPAAAIVFGAVALEQSKKVGVHAGLMFLGNASYSLYLSHIFSLGVARVLWSRAGLERNGLPYAIGFAIISMALVLAGAALSYRLLEAPLLKVLQRLVPKRRREYAAPAVKSAA